MIGALGGEGEGLRDRAMRVVETGLAVVHEGEWVVADEGSSAELRESAAQTVVEVPITVEITVPISQDERRAVAALALRELRQAFDASGRVG